MTTSQSESGAAKYANISGLIQEKTFDVLAQKFKVQNGMKVIDVGCGTGNNSFKLSQMVGESGKVVATDPIEERIKIAQKTYSAPNLEFLVAFGNDAPKFGNDFDLCVSSTVLHWIPPEEKLPTFQGIYQSLKAGGSFIFNTPKPNSYKAAALFAPFVKEVGKDFSSKYHVSSKAELEDIALKSGFKHVSIVEEQVYMTMPSLDDFIHWGAASVHVEDYDMLVSKMKEYLSKADTSSLYNDKGQVVYDDIYLYGICTK